MPEDKNITELTEVVSPDPADLLYIYSGAADKKVQVQNLPSGTPADNSITYAKIQNVSATDKLLGRSTAGAGDVEEIPCTAAGRALLDDADAAAQRTTLGLGNVDDTSDLSKPISTATQAALTAEAASRASADAALQPLDSDLSAIAALTPSNDDFIQRKTGAWANRTVAQVKTDLSLSGTNTGDQDLSQAPVSTAQQAALDLKVDENAAITGATKTKITYDAKGLVTGGTDATTADIADSTNKRYVTDADLVDIGNLSGVNTGDQDISGKANDADVVHDTGDETIAGIKTFSSDPIIPDEVYGVGWNGSLEPPTKNAVYDKIETLGGGGGVGGTLGAIDNAVTRADGTGGSTAQGSLVTIGDTGSVAIPQGAITANAPGVDHSATWNNGAVTFNAIKSDVTDTASASMSNLLSLRVGGAEKAIVSKRGNFLTTAAASNSDVLFGFLDSGNTSANGLNAGVGFADLVSIASVVLRATDARGVEIPLAKIYGWANIGVAVPDTGLARQQAKVVEVNAGSAGTAGGLLLRGLAFASLPASPVAGMEFTVTDSNTDVWGATVAGGGVLNVKVRYNGTNWTVVGK